MTTQKELESKCDCPGLVVVHNARGNLQMRWSRALRRFYPVQNPAEASTPMLDSLEKNDFWVITSQDTLDKKKVLWYYIYVLAYFPPFNLNGQTRIVPFA